MTNERETQKEIRRIVRMLEATTKLLEKPYIEGLLDNFANGEKRCIGQFNRALTRLYDLEALPEGLFEPLNEDASVGDIGYAYHQVSTYLKEGISVDFDFKQEKETIGNIMKDVGEAVTRTIFSAKEMDSEDDESSESTIESVEIVEDTPDPVEPRLDKLEEQMGTVVEILQELRSKKDKKDKKDEKK
jgi:hypothetical protein